MRKWFNILRKYTSWWVLLYFLIVTLVFTYPLVFKMRDQVVGQIGDNIYFIWLIRWYQKALFELHINPFFNPFLNYPEGWSLASTDTTPTMMLLAIPASWLGGATWGFNFAILASFVLTGWSMYLWVRHLTGNVMAGLLAGTVFAFLPYRMAHFLVGHLNLMGTMFFPFYFWSLYSLLKKPRWSWTPILGAAFSLGLISGTAPYYIYMTVLFSVVFIAVYILALNRKQLQNVEFWKNMVGFCALAVPMVLLPMLPYILLNEQGGLASRSVEYASSLSASPTDFFLPSTDHFLFGRWIGAHFDRSLWIETTLYVGIVPMALGILAFIKRKSAGWSDLAVLSMVMILLSFILALGTHLYWLNEKVILSLLPFLQNYLNRNSISIPLPGKYLFSILPLFSKMRTLARFGFIALIFTSLLSGLGAAWLLEHPKFHHHIRRTVWLCLALLGFVLFEYYPGPYKEFALVEARSVDYWLAGQPSDGAVIQFPFVQNEDQDQVYDTLIHQKPFVGGFFSANQPDQYLRIRPVLEKFPTQAGVDLLHELGVRYVVVDTRQYENIVYLDKQIRSLGLEFASEVDGQYVYLIPK
jgi:hypothetical protein